MLSVQTHQSGLRVQPLRKRGLTAAFRALVFIGFLAAFVFAPNVPAQTPKKPAAAPAVPDNRFLFIVDTSASMKRHQKDVEEAVYDILLSSASGQMHRGDSIGVWTFNADVYTGNMPLQSWEPSKQEEIALRMADFLQRQTYGRTSHLDAALAGMYEVIKRSGIITVFIISDGDGKMQGTPFDQEINDLYAKSIKEMKKKRMPIVTVLQGNGGKVEKFTVNALPWPVIIPEVPIPIKAETASQKPAFAAPPKVTNAAPPAPKPAAAAAVTAPPPAPPPQPKAIAPAQMPAPASVPTAAPVATKPPEQPPVTASAVAPNPNSPARNVAAEMFTASAVPTISPAPRANPPNNAGSGSQMANQTAPETSMAVEKNEVVSTPPPATVPVASQRDNIKSAEDIPAEKVVEKPVVSPQMTRTPAQTIQTEQAVLAPQTAPSETALAATAPPAKSITARFMALISFMGDGRQKTLLIGGVSLLVVALGLILLLVRRSRAPSRVSLISEILNHRRE